MCGAIDFHVHPFGDSAHCLNFYPEMEVSDAQTMAQALKAAGIRHICGSVLKKGQKIEAFSDLQALNRQALTLQETLGDFYTPGFHIHPAFAEASAGEIRFMKARGIRLIGELVPYMHGWGDFDSRVFMDLMDEAAGMLCSYHTPFDYDMREMLACHRDTVFIAAHPGDHDRVETHIGLMRKFDNLYLDLSGTGLFRLGLVKHLVNRVGAERILFGSDYPICNPRMYVQGVLGEDISQADKEKILCGNAERLLGRKGW